MTQPKRVSFCLKDRRSPFTHVCFYFLLSPSGKSTMWVQRVQGESLNVKKFDIYIYIYIYIHT